MFNTWGTIHVTGCPITQLFNFLLEKYVVIGVEDVYGFSGIWYMGTVMCWRRTHVTWTNIQLPWGCKDRLNEAARLDSRSPKKWSLVPYAHGSVTDCLQCDWSRCCRKASADFVILCWFNTWIAGSQMPRGCSQCSLNLVNKYRLVSTSM